MKQAVGSGLERNGHALLLPRFARHRIRHASESAAFILIRMAPCGVYGANETS